MKRSKFSLSNYKLLSCDMGELVPIGLTEVLPGDTIQQATSALIRVSPLLSPVMHPVHVRIHHWFVPHRLVWDEWEDFITGDEDIGIVFPQITIPGGGFAEGSLADYLGLPTGAAINDVSALPFRGYQLIWNEWYRDQDLQTEATVNTAGGTDNTTSKTLQNIAWEKDYFTSSRPWSQKGSEVSINLATDLPIVQNPSATAANYAMLREAGASTVLNGDVISGGGGIINNGTTNAWIDPNGSLVADGTAGSVPVNNLRLALALQRYKEARARYGSRYTEYLRYLGIRSSDARLQRPEYLGGGKQTIQFSEVLQTGVTTDGDDSEGVGNLKGHGIAALRSNRYRRFFEEHGYIFTMMSVRPKTIYAQGIPRTWTRTTVSDFFQKELQHIGSQEIRKQEIYGFSASPLDVWAYQDRYDEYRRSESTIAGQFRSSLDYWHMARIFGSEPTLNADFVKCVPTKRVNAVQTEDVLWVMANHSIQARRMVSPVGSTLTY